MEQKNFDPDGVGVDNGTYFGLPFAPETAELVLISAPWDVTVSYGSGAAYASGAAASPRPMWTIRCWSLRSVCGPTPHG